MADHALPTLLSHDLPEEKPFGAVVPPIFQNSLFTFESAAALHHQLAKDPAGTPYHYSRLGNPTVAAAARKIAEMHGTEDCRLVGCGMAAITSAIFANVAAGSHVVTIETVYPPVRSLLSDYLARFGVTVTYVSGDCTDELLDAIRPETTLVYLEAPSSFLFRMQDVRRIAAECRSRGIVTAIDNTYNSPVHFRPAELGIDIVLESATKYLGGHSDLTAGAICASREITERIVAREINLLGNILHPQSAWLLLRGMRTLPLRLKRHEATANEVAAWLEGRRGVSAVHHVGLDSHPHRALAKELLDGTGGLFCFEPENQDREAVYAYVDRLTLFGRGISWGGHESLVVPLWTRPHADAPYRWIVRLFCGLEDPADLIRDLDAAFAD